MLAQRPRTDRAFERLYRSHVRDVYRYALAVLPTPEDAEDVTQTTFLNAYRVYGRGEAPSAPNTWLIGIAHELCQQRADTRRRWRRSRTTRSTRRPPTSRARARTTSAGRSASCRSSSAPS